MRAVLWTLPVRSQKDCPVCSPCWTWVLTWMQETNMVSFHKLIQLKNISLFVCLFLKKDYCFDLVSEGKTPLLHALASSDGLTVHNTENIQLLLERGTYKIFKRTHTVITLIIDTGRHVKRALNGFLCSQYVIFSRQQSERSQFGDCDLLQRSHAGVKLMATQ